MNGRLPYMVENVYTGLLVVAVAAVSAISIVLVVRLFRGKTHEHRTPSQ